MDKDERMQFLRINSKLFRQEDIPALNEILDNADMSVVGKINLIKPVSVVLVSIFLGQFGMDRFMLGDKKSGIFKLSLIILYNISLYAIIISDADNFSLSVLLGMLIGISGIGVFLFWTYDVITSYRKTKIRNFKILAKAFGYIDAARPAEAYKGSGRSYETGRYNTSAEGSYQK